MGEIYVRDATLDDASRLLEIYSYYVENTAISFEVTTLTLAEFQGRMAKTMEQYPYLVVVKDGRVEGYAYAGPFVGREAYDKSSELTIYLDVSARKCGLGKMLYTELETRLAKMGIRNLYACIGYPVIEDAYLTTNSADFHAHMGFAEVGHFHKCGHKFDRWYDMIWMEKILEKSNKN